MTNEQRAERLIKEIGFDLDKIPKEYITELLENEINDFHEGSSEYIRLLCGYLFCIGDISDVPLIKRAKRINFDVGCMIGSEWITSLENGGKADEYTRSRERLIEDFTDYYRDFQADE